jgi:serine phosphatase RsbU (regulator of sigma subunit)
MLSAMERSWVAQDQGKPPGQEDLVVGSAGMDETIVYVSEDAQALRNAVFGRILWRLTGMLALGVIAAVIVSSILLRVVAKPMRQLVAVVTEITQGNFRVQTPRARSRELSVLSAAIDKMNETLRLGAEQRQSEMAKAREIQEHLLPASAEVPGLRLAALYRPASDVAGDYYDVVPLSDGSWLLCVADVCGHGVPAAMSAAMLKALLLHAAEHHVRPSELLRFVNERFTALSPPGLFASMLVLRWQPTKGLLEYASAGHEPACFQSSDGAVSRFDATGLPLGIEPTTSWSTQEFSPQKGERLLITTDGVAEAMNPQGELFGRQRLQSLMTHLRIRGVENLVGHVDRALREHRGTGAATDDTTILAVEFIAGALAIPANGTTPTAFGMPHRRHKQGVLH